MKKAEIFALTTGVIGLVVDSIALGTLILYGFSADPLGTAIPLAVKKVGLAILLIYGWFIVSWMLVRRSLVNSISRDYDAEELLRRVKFNMKVGLTSRDFSHRVGGTVASLGLLLLPLHMMFISVIFPISDPLFRDGGVEPDKIQWFVGVLFISVVTFGVTGFIIFIAIGLLMPIIYSDMEGMDY